MLFFLPLLGLRGILLNFRRAIVKELHRAIKVGVILMIAKELQQKIKAGVLLAIVKE